MIKLIITREYRVDASYLLQTIAVTERMNVDVRKREVKARRKPRAGIKTGHATLYMYVCMYTTTVCNHI